MIKMILFDMDNTINNWKASMYYKLVAKESGDDFEVVHRFVGPHLDRLDASSITLAQFEKTVSKRFRVPMSRISYPGCYKGNVRVRQKMIRLIKELKRKYIIALITNSERSRYPHTAKTMDLGLFDYRFVSGYTHLIKPHRAAYERVIKKTGMGPGEILFIDDKIKNVIAARKVGVQSIHFTSANTLERKLKHMKIL